MRQLILFTSTICVLLLAACATAEKEKPKTLADHIRNNNLKEVQAWIVNSGNVDTLLENGMSPIFIATGENSSADMVALILNAKADPNLGFGKTTPLMNAATYVNINNVDILLAAGANPALRNEEGKIALDLVGECERCQDKDDIITMLKGAMSVYETFTAWYSCSEMERMQIVYADDSATVNLVSGRAEPISFNVKRTVSGATPEYEGDGYKIIRTDENVKIWKDGAVLFESCENRSVRRK